MPAYIPVEMLEEMEIRAIEARERLVFWMADQTLSNMNHIGMKGDISSLTEAYIKTLEKDLK